MTGLVLTQARIDELEGYKNAGNRVAYYEALASWGSGYAELALGVVRNDTILGRTANYFMAAYADRHSVMYNSTIQTQISADFMEADFLKRESEFNLNNTGELSGEDIETYHGAVLSNYGFTIEAWTPAIGAEYYGDSFRDDALFNDSNGSQTINMLLEHMFFPATHPIQSTDPEYTAWLTNVYKAAFQAVYDEAVENGTEAVSDFDFAADLALSDLGKLAGVPVEKLSYLLNSIHHISDFVTGDLAAGAHSVYDFVANVVRFRDPLILDIDKDNVADLQALDSNASRLFDVDEDGFKEHVGWVDADDGFLCRDLNSDGQITEQSELFGNATTNGFTALAALDSNTDGKIDNTDTAWSTLKVWQDANQDGIGQSGELQTLDAIGIKSISLTNSGISTNVGGNILTEEGTFTWTDNSTSKVWDVTLATNDFWTQYSDEYELNPEVLFLPTARGYGNLPDLHIAMSQNEDLLDMVKNFQDIDISDYQALRTAAYNILVEWSGAADKGTHPEFTSSTPAASLTSEQLWLLDGFVGNTDNVGNRDDALGSVLDCFIQMYTTRLIVDSQLKVVLPDLAYDLNADKFTGTVDYEDLIGKMEDEAPATLGDKVNYWRQMSAIVNEIATSLGTSSGVYTTLMNDAISATGVPLTFAQLSAMNVISNVSTDSGWGRHYGYDYETATTGGGQAVYLVRDSNDHSSTPPPAPYTSGDDLIVGVTGGFSAYGGAQMQGGNGHDIFIGTMLNDTIQTGDGNNTAYAYDGDDTFADGSGNDTLYGGKGNDHFGLSAGNDTVYGDEGNDVIEKSSTGTLLAYGGAGNDTITASSGNDTLYGDAGNDTIAGGSGNDTLYGGDDDDTLTDTSGSDTLYGDAGNDTLTGGGNSTQYLYGGIGNDVLGFTNSGVTSNLVHKYQSGGDGNDTITFSRGINHLDGGSGDDTYVWDWIQGPGGSTFNVTTNSVYIADGSGNDELQFVDAGYAYTMERYGDDLYIYYSIYTITIENNFINPSDFKIDSISTSYGGGSTVDLYSWTPVSGENWTGTNSNNTHSGTGYSDVISGLDGADNLSGDAGRDTINGGTGNDTIDGGSQDDTLTGGTGDDTIYGRDGNDTYVFQTGDGIDFINNEGTLESFDDKVSITNVSSLSNIYFDTTTSGGTYRSLDIYYGTSDKIAINSQLYHYGVESQPTTQIEKLILGGSTTINIADDVRYYEYSSAGSLTSSATHDIVKGSSSADTFDLGDGNNSVKAGSGNDVITGGTGADWFRGEAGNDTLSGGAGNDKLEGGADNDTYVAGAGSDVFTETGGSADKITFGSGITSSNLDIYRSGNEIVIDWGSGDQIRITSNPFGNTNSRIEQILFHDTSTLDLIARDYVTKGTSSGETIYGLENGFGSNDTIYGYAGNDTLNGSDGNDTLYGGNDVDTLNGGNDNDTLYGEAGNDTLNGNNGNDILDGGAGNDAMTGGTGDDTFYVDSASDTVSEFSSGGTDTVYSSVSFTNSSQIETIILTGSANINATGTSINNTITGNSGNNTLYGSGGTDTLIGGLGNDTYLADVATVTIIENSGEGTDTVEAYLNYTLGNHLENLILFGSATTGTGNSLDNVITGNNSNNTLTGGDGNDTLDGGVGNDTMIGGTGDDTFVVGSTSDTVTENSGEGTDQIQSSVNYTISNHVENMTLTGSSNLTGTGNTLNNALTGNTGNNTLSGGDGDDILIGKAGADALTGGNNADTFVFDDTTFASTDTVSDFNTGQSDKLDISDLLIGYIPGTSNIDDFATLSVAGGNTSLLVDRDGAGSTYSDQSVVTLTGVTGLNLADMLTNGHLIAT